MCGDSGEVRARAKLRETQLLVASRSHGLLGLLGLLGLFNRVSAMGTSCSRERESRARERERESRESRDRVERREHANVTLCHHHDHHHYYRSQLIPITIKITTIEKQLEVHVRKAMDHCMHMLPINTNSRYYMWRAETEPGCWPFSRVHQPFYPTLPYPTLP